MMKLRKQLDISTEVKKALENNQPIVALESTIISHGMPYPQNVKTALTVEEVVKENGAIPATISIINGKLKIGMSEEEINYLGQKGESITKASRRDIPILVAFGGDGATTVTATMIIANLAGINVFCTGGIGGVHRGAEITMDISADLEELSKTSMLVVCAGAKSILDIARTLEYLETKGVPVIGYKTDEFPAFFSRKSGFRLNYSIDTPKEAAAILKAKNDISLQNGILIANPVPEKYSMDSDYINSKINEAIEKANTHNITGKDLTPFLLDEIQKATDGKSLKANIKLIYNNAELAAKIAYEYYRLTEKR